MFEVGDKIKFRNKVYTVLQIADNEILIEVEVIDDRGYKVKWPQWVYSDVVDLVDIPKSYQPIGEDKEFNIELGILPDTDHDNEYEGD